ncbi:hypothetical protein LCM17_13040 [Cereibacter sphaeroides]|nr:hypothetical protein [Cereibacter sphaeroides]
MARPLSPIRLIASSPEPAAPARQNLGFAPAGGRGRGIRQHRSARVLPDPVIWRGDFARIWCAFLLNRWGRDPHGIAEAFGVRVQTARNWLDGLHTPTGDVAARAVLGWRAEILAAALRVSAG